MKCRTVKSEPWRIQWVLLALFAFCFASCKDSEDNQAKPYDPNQPVEITRFSPDEGGGNTRIVVYGKNFGTDMSLLNLTIGGKKAKIISVLGDYMYAIVPQKAFKGNVEFDSTTLNSKIVSDSAINNFLYFFSLLQTSEHKLS